MDQLFTCQRGLRLKSELARVARRCGAHTNACYVVGGGRCGNDRNNRTTAKVTRTNSEHSQKNSLTGGSPARRWKLPVVETEDEEEVDGTAEGGGDGGDGTDPAERPVPDAPLTLDMSDDEAIPEAPAEWDATVEVEKGRLDELNHQVSNTALLRWRLSESRFVMHIPCRFQGSASLAFSNQVNICFVLIFVALRRLPR